MGQKKLVSSGEKKWVVVRCLVKKIKGWEGDRRDRDIERHIYIERKTEKHRKRNRDLEKHINKRDRDTEKHINKRDRDTEKHRNELQKHSKTTKKTHAF